MINRTCLFLLLVAVSANCRAEEMVRSTQEELRRRNIYFGDVDGRHTPELSEALKRYQTRKGLAVSGKEDRDTLRSLGIVTRDEGEPAPKALVWPEEPVLKSDARLDVAGMAQQISSSSGVSPSSLMPDPGATRSPMRRTQRHPIPNAEASAAKGHGSAGQFSLKTGAPLQSELTKYVRDYLRAANQNRLGVELHFYADRVNYFGNGVVDRRLIEQSLQKYYRRWPSRRSAPNG